MMPCDSKVKKRGSTECVNCESYCPSLSTWYTLLEILRRENLKFYICVVSFQAVVKSKECGMF